MSRFIAGALGALSAYLLMSFVTMEFPLHLTEWESHNRLGFILVMFWGILAGVVLDLNRSS